MTIQDESDSIDMQIADVISRWQTDEDPSNKSALIQRHPELAPGLEEALSGLQLVESGAQALVAEVTIDNENGAAVAHAESEISFPSIPGFEITSELGRGGMGVVYEAREIALGRTVALKVLPVGNVQPSAVERFTREAETIASLEHPNIVPVYAVGVHQGLHWYAMKRIDGVPLDQHLAGRGDVSAKNVAQEVVRVGIDAADALDHAHSRGVIHRDVKPSNLLVDRSDKVWLTDFGLARRDVDVTATASGAMVGTPRYMSAEQISQTDDKIDRRTDIYSLGATLYEMTTGRPVFDSQSPLDLLNKILNDDPIAPRQLQSGISRPLELVMLKCLDKDPPRRYETAALLANDLRAVRDHQPIAARGLPLWLLALRYWRRHERVLRPTIAATICCILGLLLLGLAVYQIRQSNIAKFRINTPGGLYFANIIPVDSDSSQSGKGMLVTTPNQQALALPVGDYLVRFESQGRPSETLEVTLDEASEVDFRYVDRRKRPKQIDIHNKLAREAGDGSLIVLDKEALSVFESDGRLRFSLDCEQLAEGIATEIELAKKQTPRQTADENEPVAYFGFDPELPFQGDQDVGQSGFAQLVRIRPLANDLDGDGENDFLITAARWAAVVAISSRGKILWRRKIALQFDASIKLQQYPRKEMPEEPIVGIDPIGLVDGDQIVDLVVNTMLVNPCGPAKPAIVTLSGRTGETIQRIDLPQIDMSRTDWPWGGLLRFSKQFSNNGRARRQLSTHHRSFSRAKHKSWSSRLDNLTWSHSGRGSAMYVLPRLSFRPSPNSHAASDEPYIATTAIGKSVVFVDLAKGEVKGVEAKLPHAILCGPKLARLPGNITGAVAVSADPSTANTKCQLHLCVPDQPKPIWSVRVDLEGNELAHNASGSQFPIIADLDGDEIDEILFCTNKNHHEQTPKIRCFKSSGHLTWESDVIAGTELLVSHAIVLGDVDRDGVRDVATAMVAADPKERIGVSNWGYNLCVDFISGATGKRIGCRREPITVGEENYDVLEIDEFEFQRNKLVCSIVYGETNELSLASLTISMDLATPRATQVNRGLTVLPSPISPHSRGRWFRQRSGPYAPFADHAVWISNPRAVRNLGDKQPGLSWVQEGTPKTLLRHSQRVECVDIESNQLLWNKEMDVDTRNAFRLPREDASLDLLLQSQVYGGARTQQPVGCQRTQRSRPI